ESSAEGPYPGGVPALRPVVAWLSRRVGLRRGGGPPGRARARGHAEGANRFQPVGPRRREGERPYDWPPLAATAGMPIAPAKRTTTSDWPEVSLMWALATVRTAATAVAAVGSARQGDRIGSRSRRF